MFCGDLREGTVYYGGLRVKSVPVVAAGECLGYPWRTGGEPELGRTGSPPDVAK